MTYRKTWFSYVLWLLYAVLCIALLVYAGRIWTNYLAGIPYTNGFPDSLATPFAGLSDGQLILIGLLIIPVTIALYWIIREIAGQIRKKCVWKKDVIARFECIVALLLLAGGIFLRLDNARLNIAMAEKGLDTESEVISAEDPFFDAKMQGMMYYDMALVTQERSESSVVCYSIRELYVICMSVVLSFLGNKISSAIIMQVLLQIIGMILIYAVTRKAAGRIPACVSLLYLACSLCCLEMLVLFGPEWLFFDLYMVGMLVGFSFVKRYCANQLSRSRAIAAAAGIGVMIGILAYLDIAAATLLIIIAAAVIIGKKYRNEGAAICNSGMVSALVVLVAFIVSLLVRGVMIGAIYGSRGVDLLRNVVNQWMDLRQLFGEAFVEQPPYVSDIYLMGMLVIPAVFLIFEFFKSGREQNYMLWIFICVLMAPTPMAARGTVYSGLLSLYVWSVLAGLGLQNCIFGGRAKIMQEKAEKISAATVWAELENKSEKVEGTEKPETEKTRPAEQPGEAEKQEKPRYFENPLPLPKKHVKKEMDYQYPVEEKDMKYDVDVPEDDDFDIQ